MKHAPKVLGTLGLAAASGGIHKAIAGSGTTKTGGFGPLAGMMLGSVLTPLIGKLLGGGQGKGLRLPGTDWGTGLRLPGTAGGGKRKKERAKV